MDTSAIDELIRELKECRIKLESTRESANLIGRDIACPLERVEHIKEKLNRLKEGVFN